MIHRSQKTRRSLTATLALLGCLCVLPISAPAATTVALTLSRPQASQKKQAETFFALLEMNVLAGDFADVVERRQLDQSFREMLLNRAAGDGSLQWGKLSKADLILNVELQNGPPGLLDPLATVRIAEPLTGVIRGVTVVAVDQRSPETAAEQVSQYLRSVIESPEQAAVTVAVGAFESDAKFDRLRPLELGVRDMLTTGLLNVSRFRVLQRSDLNDLLAELDLVLSGLIDPKQIPESLPRRASTYLVRGRLNEKYDGQQASVVVRGELVHAASSKIVHSFQLESAPGELPAALSKAVYQLATVLTKHAELKDADLDQPKGRNETKQLLDRALADLYRFRRRSPIHGGSRDFRVPGYEIDERVAQNQNVVRSDSELAVHLLTKSIDRLETILYIDPANNDAAFALAFCLAHDHDGVGDPVRAGDLLKKVFQRVPDSELGEQALRLMAGVSFHHTRGIVTPVKEHLSANAARQIRYAFENMPEAHRDFFWARMLELYAPRFLQPNEIDNSLPLIQVARQRIDELPDGSTRRELITEVSSLAAAVNSDAAWDLLREWAEDDDPKKRYAGCLRLAMRARKQRDDEAAAKWYAQGASGFVDSEDLADRRLHENMLIHSATHLRKAGLADQALERLATFTPSVPHSLNRGYYDLERGICLAMQGKEEQAVEIWTIAAEQVPGLCFNSDVDQRIAAHGGVRLASDRLVDVRYLSINGKNAPVPRAVATDGRRLFCSSGLKDLDVVVYDPESQRWTTIGKSIGVVTSMQCTDGQLWVGTKANGLHRYDVNAGQWTRWHPDNQFPDRRIESVNVIDDAAYIGVGDLSSGGLVRVNEDGSWHVHDEPGAPNSAPTHVVREDNHLYARTVRKTFVLSDGKDSWKPAKTTAAIISPTLYRTESGLWASSPRHELEPFGEHNPFPRDRFQSCWYPKGRNKAGYYARYVIEHDDAIWFGGTAYEAFQSAGFYRLDKATGEMTMFGPRDGFRLSTQFDTYDGVWATDRFWLATPKGIAEVTIRE